MVLYASVCCALTVYDTMATRTTRYNSYSNSLLCKIVALAILLCQYFDNLFFFCSSHPLFMYPHKTYRFCNLTLQFSVAKASSFATIVSSMSAVSLSKGTLGGYIKLCFYYLSSLLVLSVSLVKTILSFYIYFIFQI